MTGQRRRGNPLRADLGLAPVPPYVGAELRTITDPVSAQVRARLRGALPRYATLPGEAQQRLISAVFGAMEEFTRIIEDQPLATPSADALLIEIARESDHPERFILALHTTLETVRGVMHESWARLPRSRPYSAWIDAALAEYAARLCTRTMNALHPPADGPPAPGRSDEIRLARLFTVAERRWGDQPVQLCLRTHLPAARDRAAPTSRAQPVTPRPGTPRPLRLAASDHVLMISRHEQTPVPPPHGPARSSRPARPMVALWVGPVAPGELVPAYDTVLLLFRLVGAGVAAPPPPVVLPLPDLGFLHPRHSDATVARIAHLLGPLARQSAHRRVALARTMQLFLRTAGPAHALADQLRMHAQTVRNHLGVVRQLYGSHDLDFGRDTLTIQAALAMVLPLWELEASR